MPGQASRVRPREREIEVLLTLDPFGCPKHEHFTWRMSRPFEGSAIVSHTQIVNFALLHQ